MDIFPGPRFSVAPPLLTPCKFIPKPKREMRFLRFHSSFPPSVLFQLQRGLGVYGGGSPLAFSPSPPLQPFLIADIFPFCKDDISAVTFPPSSRNMGLVFTGRIPGPSSSFFTPSFSFAPSSVPLFFSSRPLATLFCAGFWLRQLHLHADRSIIGSRPPLSSLRRATSGRDVLSWFYPTRRLHHPTETLFASPHKNLPKITFVE